MNCLIVGYGIVGHNLNEEILNLNPDIYDKYTNINTKKASKYDITFICVDTPLTKDNSLDITEVRNAINENDSEIYVIKSTCPIGTVDMLKEETGKRILYSPEFYGNTQHNNNFKFDFTILGGDKEDSIEVIQALQNCFDGRHQFRITDSKTAELTKLMSNSFLATKVSFCNQFYNLCQKYNVSYEELRELFTLDERVNNSHTFVYKNKPYWNTHCLNKDVSYIAYHEDAELIKSICEFNQKQKFLHEIKKIETKELNNYIKVKKALEKYQSTHSLGIYDRTAVEKSLNEDGLRIKDYGDEVQSDLNCVLIAIRSNLEAYNYINDNLKLNKDVIDAYWETYIKKDEEEIDFINQSEDSKYVSYIPEHLNINHSLEDVIESLTRKRY